MKPQFLILSLALVLAGSATYTSSLAFNEPDGFRGITWKSSEANVNAKWPGLSCYPSSSPPSDRTCSSDTPISIGDIPVLPLLGFRSNEFSYVMFSFDEAKFRIMERIFTERYGPPTRQNQREEQNRMGARYMNEMRHWIGPTVSITLQRYGSKLTEGLASFVPTSMAQDMAKQIEATANKGAGDL
jgi:hypothetical protein